MHYDTLARYRFQHHEMVHVPVQNSRTTELPQVFQFKPEWAAEQVQLTCNQHQSAERNAVERHRMRATQSIEIKQAAVIRSHHRQAGKPTLCSLRLADYR